MPNKLPRWYGPKPSKHVADKLLGRECGAHFLGGWDADDFFVTLAQKLECFPPRFVTQPFSHLKSMFSMLSDYYSVFLSWGHALSDLARKAGSAKDYTAAFEKYRRAAEIKPMDTAAHHSWYYGLLELAKRSKGMKKEALIEQAKAVSREQQRRRRRQIKHGRGMPAG